MTRRALVHALALSLLLSALLPISVAGADSAPFPTSMAAVGDSITQAASSGGTLGADAPENSWATGWSSTVNSHAIRLGVTASAHNLSVSGAKVGGLADQMDDVIALSPDPGYLTVLIGGNDLCTESVTSMTSTTAFYTAFKAAMEKVVAQSPGTYVYVVSIPDVYQLWNLFKNNFFARLVWASADICQSLLANPGSTAAADDARRKEVRARNIAFNAILADVCDDYPSRCHYDGDAVFNTAFTRSDVSGDYFHPSVTGQAKLAAVSWTAGYTWTTTPPPVENQPPAAPSGLTATGGDGSVALTWTSNGEADLAGYRVYRGTTSGGPYALISGAALVAETTASYSDTGLTNGTTYHYVVTAVDDAGNESAQSAQASATPAAPTGGGGETVNVYVGALDGQASAASRGNTWTATVTILVVDGANAPVGNAAVTGTWTTGGTSECITDAATGTCQVAVSLNAKKTTSTTFIVSTITGDNLAYVEGPTTSVEVRL